MTYKRTKITTVEGKIIEKIKLNELALKQKVQFKNFNF